MKCSVQCGYLLDSSGPKQMKRCDWKLWNACSYVWTLKYVYFIYIEKYCVFTGKFFRLFTNKCFPCKHSLFHKLEQSLCCIRNWRRCVPKKRGCSPCPEDICWQRLGRKGCCMSRVNQANSWQIICFSRWFTYQWTCFLLVCCFWFCFFSPFNLFVWCGASCWSAACINTISSNQKEFAYQPGASWTT